MPMLDPKRFPQEAVRIVSVRKENPTEDDVEAAREASVALAVESAVQIVEAKRTSNQVIEDSDSLKQMLRMVNTGAGLIMQTESSSPEVIIEAGREIIKRREGAKGLEEAGGWDDQEVLDWVTDHFKKAAGRLQKGIGAIEASHRF